MVLRHNISDRGAGALYVNDIFSTGVVLTMTDTLVEQNEGQYGGALRVSGATSFLYNVTIANNHTTTAHNGALNMWGGDATLTNVTVSGNSAAGIHITNFGSITMTNSTVAHNENFGLSTYATSVIHNTIIATNNGSGANCFLYQPHWNDSLGYNLEDGNSCSFDQPGDQVNTDPQLQPLAYSGGALMHAFVADSPAIDEADNNACPARDQRGVNRPQDGDDDGAAVCDITVTLLNSTVAYNDGSAFGNFATIQLQNSIVASNGERNCWSEMTSLGNNLENDDTCGFDQATDIVDADPLLKDLAHNGGPTPTHLPAPHSLALDAANGDACPAIDQRGVARP